MINFILENIFYIYVGAIISVAIFAAILFVWPFKPTSKDTFFKLK